MRCERGDAGVMSVPKFCRTVQRYCRLGAVLSILGLLVSLAEAKPPPEKRILFLGDSITYQGTYVSIVEAALITQYPDRNYSIVNMGLGSETVSGLSEEGHAGGRFPRPDLNERLDRILTQHQPDLVIACYGMNDGIYLPLAEDRIAAYRKGIIRLRAKVMASGARIIHLTSPVFDPLPIPDRVNSRDGKPAKFFGGYNDVLGAYADWLVDQSEQHGWTVWDLHNEMNQALARERETDPGFTFARDGVHPNSAGHLVMAGPVLRNWELTDALEHVRGEAVLEIVQQKQRMLRDAWLTQVGHQRPGVAAGIPLPQAEAKAAKLDAEARALIY
jgi:lysophospholipase L1-like esterase